MKPIVFELYANLERLAGTHELRLELTDGATTVADAVNQLATARPELASSLERCACVTGDTIIRRVDALPVDGRIALLPPVAGG
jgi:molybdopterin synthase sulfur carrier subunit